MAPRDGRPADRVPLTRRRLLASAGAAAGTLAGCTGRNPFADDPPQITGSSMPSPGSAIAPTDGFADVGWLVDADPEVVRVTNLEVSGEGSLGRALSGDGPRVVVFEVGGVIDFDGSMLPISGEKLFVAGQTAPSPGITITKGNLVIGGSDVVVQHLRVRPGDGLAMFPRRPKHYQPSGDEGASVDAIRIGGQNVIVDHCSASWGSDENTSVVGGSPTRDVTISNSIVSEGLHNTKLHPESDHSMGTLVLNDVGRTAIVGNLWANNNDRHPRLKGGTRTVVANNLAYNFGEDGVEIGGDGSRPVRASIVGNRYRAGPDTDRSGPAIELEDGARPPAVYLADNTADPDDLTVVDPALSPVGERPLWPDGLAPVPSGDVMGNALDAAGARPADRSPVDARIVREVRERSGAIIDSQADVGGYPVLEETSRSLEVPDEGLLEWLYGHARAVETSGLL